MLQSLLSATRTARLIATVRSSSSRARHIGPPRRRDECRSPEAMARVSPSLSSGISPIQRRLANGRSPNWRPERLA
jgi:hypothetical protein